MHTYHISKLLYFYILFMVISFEIAKSQVVWLFVCFILICSLNGVFIKHYFLLKKKIFAFKLPLQSRSLRLRQFMLTSCCTTTLVSPMCSTFCQCHFLPCNTGPKQHTIYQDTDNIAFFNF